jgi:ATP/maltotriose-dependent transcriptional regulator MalT
MGAPRALALCANFGGALDFQAGRWSEAETKLREAVRLYEEVGSASGQSLSLQRLAVLLTARGDLDEARETLNEGLVVAERAAMRSHCLTRMHASMIRNRLAAKDEAGIETSLAAGHEAMSRHGDCVTCSALLLPEMIRAAIELGQLDEAEKHASSLEASAKSFESKVWTAMSSMSRARVLLATGDAEGAAASFDSAGSVYEAVGQPYEAARCFGEQALCLRASGDDRGADALSSKSKQILAELGAPGIE